jgi:hypothetical protein
MASPDQLKSVWPAETDLTFVPGTKKVMLMAQQPIICSVIQDSFEWIRVALAFKNAFPDTFVALDFVQDSLLEAAESHDRASDIYRWLLCDANYMNRMMCLVRFLFSFMMLLTFYSASCMHCALPSRCQGALCHHCAG